MGIRDDDEAGKAQVLEKRRLTIVAESVKDVLGRKGVHERASTLKREEREKNGDVETRKGQVAAARQRGGAQIELAMRCTLSPEPSFSLRLQRSKPSCRDYRERERERPERNDGKKFNFLFFFYETTALFLLLSLSTTNSSTDNKCPDLQTAITLPAF